jgi:uncharacterized protein (TIRG00374 family)
MTSPVLTAPRPAPSVRNSQPPLVLHPNASAPPLPPPAPLSRLSPTSESLGKSVDNLPTAIRRRWWRLILLTVGIILAVVELRGHLPNAASTWTALRRASPAWLLTAVVLQVVSIGAFAEQQRHLLAAFGVRMPASVSLAVTYARSAMAAALPGGSAVSAGYAFRQFCARGASQLTAAAVMLLSGVASVIGLAVLYTGDALAWTSPFHRTLAIIAAIIAAVTAAVAWGVRRARAIPPASATVTTPMATTRQGSIAGTSALGRLRRTLRHTTSVARTVPARRWLGVVALAALNWLTDLACLLTSLHAVGLTVPARTVATAYLATQLIRQIPATPGGIGVIEASLVVTLTTAGATQAPAAAAVLIYRVLSCWTILPIGLICWTRQKTPAAPRTQARTPLLHSR